MVRTETRTSSSALMVVDVLALVAFVLAGMRSHHTGSAAAIFARNAVPLVGCWFAAALVFHPSRGPGLAPLLRTWAAATPVALLLRTALVGSPTGVRLVVFLVVGMAFTLLFLLVGRALVTIFGRLVVPGRDAQ